MAVNIPGVVVIAIFYLLVFGCGIWASFKARREQKKSGATSMNMAVLGNRNINWVVGVFSMTATWVGGGFIVGTTEMVYTPSTGLLSAILMLVAYMTTYALVGLIFAKRMRESRYTTMLDPFHLRYGPVLTSVISMLSVLLEMLYIPATLISLGGVMAVILDLDYNACVWISAAVAVTYTLLGGLYSVAYTDVIQLSLVFFGLWFCVPFTLMTPHSLDISKTLLNNSLHAPWIGEMKVKNIGLMIDQFLFLSLGSLGNQCLHQRILSSPSISSARRLCLLAAIFLPLFTIPSMLFGAVAASTDWNQTSYGSPSPYERGEAAMALPIILLHLTPNYVSIICTACIAAAVMSSADSMLLSSSSLFSTNIYKNILRPQASDKEIHWVIQISVVVAGVFGTALAHFKNSPLLFMFLSIDMAYVLIVPQLICILFIKVTNGYGGIMGLVSGLLIRLLSGETLLGIPPILLFPGYALEDGVYVQYAPVKSISMIIGFSNIVLFSSLTHFLFHKGVLPNKFDVFRIQNTGSLEPVPTTMDTKESVYFTENRSAKVLRSTKF